jgi:iron complex transport system substrate-binding protein
MQVPNLEPRLRRTLATLLVPVALLAACGDDDTTADRTADPAPTADTAGDESFPRTVEHAMGITEIPDRPDRVVVLDTGELDSAIALGVTPVGAVRAPVEDGFLEYLSEETAETELVGTIDDVNLEAVAALRPDLILSSKLRHEDIYDELSAIAPTVFTETVGVVWKDNLAVHAEALGLEDEADQLLADYDERTADIAARLQDERGQLPTISMVRFLPEQTRLYQKASFIGTILEDVGLPRPESQDVDDFAANISAEELEMADADIIFTSHYGPADDTTKAQLTGNPLWDQLGAVQAGDVHEVADDHWMLGIGIGAATLVLDDLERLLLDG